MVHNQGLINLPRAPLEGSVVRCYHYMATHFEEVLKNSQLKLSAAIEFNDVFDCMGTCIGLPTSDVIYRHIRDNTNISKEKAQMMCSNLIFCRKYIKGIEVELRRRSMFNVPNILCFSRPKNVYEDSLMWSHYGGKWKGVRLGFDLLYENHIPIVYKTTSPYAIVPVIYAERQPILDWSKVKDLDSDSSYACFYFSMVNTKSKAWRYENEWRLFCDETHSSKRGDMRFWDFNRVLLRTIDLGPTIDNEAQKRVIELTSALYPHAEVRKVVVSDADYAFIYQSILKPTIMENAMTAYGFTGGAQ